MFSDLNAVIDTQNYDLGDVSFRDRCRQSLADSGALVLPEFLRPGARRHICTEGDENEHHAFYSTQRHNVYLEPADPALGPDHPRNRSAGRRPRAVSPMTSFRGIHP